MIGNTTCFVYDQPSNRNVCITGEINADSLEIFSDADSIKSAEIGECSEIVEIMKDNFKAEHIHDSDIEKDIEDMFSPDSVIYIAIKGNESAFVLFYD